MSTKSERERWARSERIVAMLEDRGIEPVGEHRTPKLDGPVVAVVTIIPGKSVFDAAVENFDMDAAKARWDEWDRVLADVLELGEVAVLSSTALPRGMIAEGVPEPEAIEPIERPETRLRKWRGLFGCFQPRKSWE